MNVGWGSQDLGVGGQATSVVGVKEAGGIHAGGCGVQEVWSGRVRGLQWALRGLGGTRSYF